MNIHLVLYSNNEPFNTTKRLIIESISNFTNKNIIIHDYDLEKIKKKDWFKFIKDFPDINIDINYKYCARRDGYYNAWKSFIVKDVYDEMNENDILYYVDSSKYFIEGFKENIDKICDITKEIKCIAGCVSDDIKNNTNESCHNIGIWDKIIKDKDNTKFLNKMHVLNSWFLFSKCETNTSFINEWVYFSSYTDDDNKYPIVMYHHTVDQSIFNILVIKYNLTVFYSEHIDHNTNKNKNVSLYFINNKSIDIDYKFIKLNE